ncbi:helix-turn-helix domain-containing protein [Desulfitobacterium sp. AusDCA]|uniref:helix-turn-helix domain-containing protein n=1 Tax=Desulfitobacterium sp. AusDCA TaxID=3240383 RepID=UPI003DA798AA
MGKKIAEFRQVNNLTQKELAEKAEISVSYLKKIEGGHYKKPHLKVLVRLADALGTDLERLLREEE